MSKTCETCTKALPKNQNGVATCKLCLKTFHVTKECCGLYASQWELKGKEAKSKWVCDGCRIGSGSGSVGLSAEDNNYSLADVMKLLQSFKDELTTQMNTLNESVSFMSAKYDAIITEQEKLKEVNRKQAKSIQELNNKVDYLHKELTSVTDSMHELQAQTRKQHVEIRGIDLVPGENLYLVMNKLATRLQLPNDFDVIHRLKPRVTGKPPDIIIKFLSQSSKEKWLKMRSNSLKCSDIISNASESRIYINDCFSPYLGYLFSQAKKRSKAKGFKYCWCKGGKVFLKYNDTSTSVITLKRLEDLDRLLGSPRSPNAEEINGLPEGSEKETCVKELFTQEDRAIATDPGVSLGAFQ